MASHQNACETVGIIRCNRHRYAIAADTTISTGSGFTDPEIHAFSEINRALLHRSATIHPRAIATRLSAFRKGLQKILAIKKAITWIAFFIAHRVRSELDVKTQRKRRQGKVISLDILGIFKSNRNRPIKPIVNTNTDGKIRVVLLHG